MHYNHIFGPVLSRRLGISLGVDLVVHKTCSLDCIYCECGKTTCLTRVQKEYVGLQAVKTELDDFWQHNDDPDYITFSGSGEPTLNPCIGQVIAYIKDKKPQIKIAVLTNATLFDDPAVRQALLKADRVVPSLDAASQGAFERINRPHRNVDLAKMIQGIQAFAKAYKGELFLEVLILPGINDDPEDLILLKKAIHQIKPDRVQLNTLDRPGTEPDIRPADKRELEQVIQILDYSPIEITARVDTAIQTRTNREDIRQAIIETVHRRPCTKKDLVQTLGVESKLIDACIEQLEREKKITGVSRERGVFYQTVKDPEKEDLKKS